MIDAHLFPKAVVLLEVARLRSFRAAGQHLGLSPSTVSEHVRSLEEAFGLRLLERTTRRVVLTDDGRTLLEFVERSLNDWQEGCEQLRQAQKEPRGVVRVTAPTYIGIEYVSAVIAEMTDRYARVRMELALEDTVSDLFDDRYDVAVRTGPLPADLPLHARRISRDREVIVAHPALADIWNRVDIEALIDAPWCMHERFLQRPSRLEDSRSHICDLKIPSYRAVASSSHGLLALAERRVGLALIPMGLCRGPLDSGRLARVHSEWSGRSFDIFALCVSKRHRPPRITHFLDLLQQRCPDPL